MEVVSPTLNTRQSVTDTISEFWEAMSVHFDVQRDTSCGGHVHVTPMRNGNKFTLDELKKVAFATVFYEDYITSILPLVRRTNDYCKPNSKSTNRKGESCRLRTLLASGKTLQSLQNVAVEIRTITSGRDLCQFMQKTRYVLWNYQNIFPSPSGKYTGTVEFRGGSQFLNTKGTLSWVAFVMGFMTLALDEVSRLPAL
jgi:Putative amidoligase enzyme